MGNTRNLTPRTLCGTKTKCSDASVILVTAVQIVQCASAREASIQWNLLTQMQILCTSSNFLRCRNKLGIQENCPTDPLISHSRILTTLEMYGRRTPSPCIIKPIARLILQQSPRPIVSQLRLSRPQRLQRNLEM